MTGSDDLLLDAFAKALRARRQARDLSQEELAHLAGLSMRYIALLESRRHQPSLATVQGLCSGLGISMAEFVAEVEARLADPTRHERQSVKN